MISSKVWALRIRSEVTSQYSSLFKSISERFRLKILIPTPSYPFTFFCLHTMPPHPLVPLFMLEIWLQGFDIKDQKYVACKIHQLNKDWKDDKKANYIKWVNMVFLEWWTPAKCMLWMLSLRHALREYNIHKQLDHPRIVRLFDVFEIDNNSWVVIFHWRFTEH